jgi:hypothetical protein
MAVNEVDGPSLALAGEGFSLSLARVPLYQGACVGRALQIPE